MDKMTGIVERQLTRKLARRKLHFSLIDPDPEKADAKTVEAIAKKLQEFGTDAVLVGGSTRVNEENLDRAITAIKKHCSAPVILSPGNANGVSRKTNSMHFMSFLNSQDALWVS